MAEPAARIRLDKWLWQARFFKTRSLSAKVVSAGHVRVNSQRVTKPATMIGPDDVLTFSQADEVRVIRVAAPGTRRGPASEAQTLYEDLAPPKPREAAEPQAQPPKYERKGRPTKRDRRLMDQTRSQALD
ncbi:RNA-binding S4 domain-containing protein [Puniceibacterium sediminis]|uniref:Heat shock protein Hsp15 n=1 Tax=Puniceibacterium sediminis TaxID=1608407 RepID=A0A238X9Q0_9RHOB|nr:RNA-binding S4 domain-containing protein [Puniceibacterium sediminis]SNR55776.1 heat shock protein Hsp15 [Puniceibacterium sediminis]